MTAPTLTDRLFDDADQSVLDPFAVFEDWFAEARLREPNDPHAMAVASVDADEAHRLLAAKYGIQLRVLQLVQLITRATRSTTRSRWADTENGHRPLKLGSW